MSCGVGEILAVVLRTTKPDAAIATCESLTHPHDRPELYIHG
jgi:PleD family two-component response regulator